jgi:peptide/nickel transport system substrate-binding protein
MKGRFSILIALLLVASMVLSACGGAAAPAAPPAAEAPATEAAVEAPAAEAPAAEAPATEAAAEAPADANALPRNETLYSNGQQWGPVVGWNPYSNSNNNAMAIAQQDNARVIMFETPYLYNMLDGQQYPLLADGPFSWNDARTEMTFKIKPAAKWSDGTPVTAEDVAYTWATHVKYNTPTGAANIDFIDAIEAVDPQTVVIKAKLDENGNAVNPLLVAAYVSTNYVIQKAWTETLEARVAGDPTQLLADPAEDVVYSGPYHKFFADDSKVVYVRDDNYWGQDASMWGKLPAPKYLAHTIFKDNAAGTTALQAGEVDVSQQFNSNVQDLWEKQNLPISTYLPSRPMASAPACRRRSSTCSRPAWIRSACARPLPWPWTTRRSSPMP